VIAAITAPAALTAKAATTDILIIFEVGRTSDLTSFVTAGDFAAP